MTMPRITPALSATTLTGFRQDLYRCMTSWADALFELCDATLHGCAAGALGPPLEPRDGVPPQPRQPVQGAGRRTHRQRRAAGVAGRQPSGRLAAGVRGRRLDLGPLRCGDLA